MQFCQKLISIMIVMSLTILEIFESTKEFKKLSEKSTA